MDMKKILQALDTASSKPVEGSNDMKKFMSVVTEGANPHKVTLPVQMAMQHYAEPAATVTPKKPSLLKQYFAEAEAVIAEENAVKEQALKQYSQKIANKVLMKESKQKLISENQQVPAVRDERTIQQEIKVLQKKLTKVEYARAKARELTKSIKYDNTASEIITGVRALAATDIGIDETELKYAEEEVFTAIRTLEASVYGLEQAFEDAIRDTSNSIDELEGEIGEIHWQKKYGRPEV